MITTILYEVAGALALLMAVELTCIVVMILEAKASYHLRTRKLRVVPKNTKYPRTRRSPAYSRARDTMKLFAADDWLHRQDRSHLL